MFLWAAVLAGAPALAQEPAAAEREWSLSAGLDRSSLYLFRGVDLLDGEAVFVPNARWEWKGFAATYYGYVGDLPADGTYVEHDLALDYTFDLGSKAALTLGGLTYQYNQDAERQLAFFDTLEVYGIVALDVPLAPTFSYYHDIDQVDGGYATLAVSHEFALGERVALALAASVGWDFHYNNKDASNGSLNDALVGVKLPVQVSERFSLYAGVQHSIALEALDQRVEADPNAEGIFGDQTVVTVGGSLAF
jgi:hypothetical protein